MIPWRAPEMQKALSKQEVRVSASFHEKSPPGKSCWYTVRDKICFMLMPGSWPGAIQFDYTRFFFLFFFSPYF